MTQKNSRSRVKDPGDLNATLAALYSAYRKQDLTGFYSFCTDLVRQSNTSNERKKMAFLAVLMSVSGDKDRLLKRTQDYFLAGAGLGV